jgi:transitional endoplasmic reticulum ATPase
MAIRQEIPNEILKALQQEIRRVGKTLGEAGKQTVAADIVFQGEKLIVPDGMNLDQAIELIQRRQAYEDQETAIVEKFDVFPLDGAAMLDNVIQRRYGWSPMIPTPGFFQDNPPQMRAVEVGYGEVRHVPWGRFKLPNVEGVLDTGAQMNGERFVFILQATIKRRDEATVRALFAELRDEIKVNSIYRGKAIRINFLDDEGDVIPDVTPTFLDVNSVDETKLVLSEHLERAVRTNLFTPITRTQDCLNNGIAVKRGVLLGGIYGTGKTMIAHIASKLAAQHGITFIYIQHAVELAHAIEFGRQYQSPACVIFCEDIDREVTGERTEEMDAVLNTIDGIDSKASNIIVVLTTNNIEGIHPAMLRPGRLDAVIDVTAPDAKAIERLVRVYAGRALAHDVDLSDVGKVLAGNIPAVIAEVVKRAKLAQLSLQERGTQVTALTSEALLESARTIQAQVQLLNPKAMPPSTRLEDALREVVKDAMNGNSERIQTIATQVSEIHESTI